MNHTVSDLVTTILNLAHTASATCDGQSPQSFLEQLLIGVAPVAIEEVIEAVKDKHRKGSKRKKK